MKTITKRLAVALLGSIASVSVTTAQAALVTGDVGDYVEMYANGPQGSETRLGVFTSSLFLDLNLGREERQDVGRTNPYTSSSGLYASASAGSGRVGAQASLDWVNPIDYWDGSARAETADVVRISNVAKAGQTVSINVHAGVSGGMTVFGPAAYADAIASFSFEGISGLRPGGSTANAVPNFHTFDGFSGTGFASIFRDHAEVVLQRRDGDGNPIFSERYEYGQRDTTWLIDVLLDANGNGSFWTLLDLDVRVGEEGDCANRCDRFGTPIERGVAASDYAHTVIGYYSAADERTFITSTAGWSQPAVTSDVPEPTSLALLSLGLAGLMGIRRRTSK